MIQQLFINVPIKYVKFFNDDDHGNYEMVFIVYKNLIMFFINPENFITIWKYILEISKLDTEYLMDMLSA